MTDRSIIRVIPPAHSSTGEYVTTQGTKVRLANGSELAGITSIEMIGEANNIWRARIECMCSFEDFPLVVERLRLKLSHDAKHLTDEQIVALANAMMMDGAWRELLQAVEGRLGFEALATMDDKSVVNDRALADERICVVCKGAGEIDREKCVHCNGSGSEP